jgi:hypothetical protein
MEADCNMSLHASLCTVNTCFDFCEIYAYSVVYCILLYYVLNIVYKFYNFERGCKTYHKTRKLA